MSQKQDSTNKTTDTWLADLYSDQRDQKTLKKQEKHALAEKNGPKGLEPTRYGDWEKSGRCIDF